MIWTPQWHGSEVQVDTEPEALLHCGWERDAGTDDLALVPYPAWPWSGNWDRLSQQEDEINEHSRGRGEVTSRTEAGTWIIAQEAGEE